MRHQEEKQSKATGSLPHQDDCKTRIDTKYRTTKHRTITESHNQDDCKTRIDTKYRTTKHRTITESHNGSNNQQ